ncbi:endonuclease/exonuclease/phosphatase family protein [Flavobacterium sp. CYK-4]|uniref:endonuclease/exonuclease/phosphatase family protein n=1 Tax=Flavobacterium lotistagni TaxID=2709660 RepID=UPI00140953D9|nr:endonuclease/exonuclease/phosphatase family protein [Flavobacterium lotistagni]NHM05699.1 endonuclease/exonuclease/phosphatase family protein [Flavobacterium lotistagni]
MLKNLITLIAICCSFSIYCQTKILSWNLEDFGKSKSAQTIAFIANVSRDYDIVAVQEVVAGNGGVQAIAKLADELNRKGSKWDYVVSDPTSSSAYKTERYAFLWKTAKVRKIGKAWLEKEYHLEIDREPFLCTFQVDEKQFTIANFHAITKSKQPETEIKYLKFLPSEYKKLNILFVGDFNCPQSHTVFNPLKKMGYKSIFIGQKTSLKNECKGKDCLASEFDNIFYDSNKIKPIKSGAIHFYDKFSSLKEARQISDHIPIWFELSLH